jgi:hypothetical protein
MERLGPKLKKLKQQKPISSFEEEQQMLMSLKLLMNQLLLRTGKETHRTTTTA